MNQFKKDLKKKLNNSQFNHYGIDNFDVNRFGDYTERDTSSIFKSFILQLAIVIKFLIKLTIRHNAAIFNEYHERFECIYNHLTSKDKKLFIELISYRILGYKKVKLQRNNQEYRNAINTGISLQDSTDSLFNLFTLYKCSLSKIGVDIVLYSNAQGIAVDFILEQYAYKGELNEIIEVKKGDIVLDLGAFGGDTALYFAFKAENCGKVYSFEFIPKNIELFNKNIALNPKYRDQICLIQHPVSNKSNDIIYFKDDGPGSRIQLQAFDEQTGSCNTISIDDFVKQNGITKIDFIKMDIEGAELKALEGAIETIKRFKPKLAIAIYHSIDDMANIPLWIINLQLDYHIFIDHFTIHKEETILFAK